MTAANPNLPVPEQATALLDNIEIIVPVLSADRTETVPQTPVELAEQPVRYAGHSVLANIGVVNAVTPKLS